MAPTSSTSATASCPRRPSSTSPAWSRSVRNWKPLPPREDRGRPVQSRRTGFAGSRAALPAQPVRRSAIMRLPGSSAGHWRAFWPPPRTDGAGQLRQHRRPSPILSDRPQAQAVPSKRHSARLAMRGTKARLSSPCATGIRRTEAVGARSSASSPDDIVLLPLYPQYSTTTTDSSLKAWNDPATFKVPTRGLMDYRPTLGHSSPPSVEL